MKKYLLLSLFFLALLAAKDAGAKIWRVNNKPGITADFTNLFHAVGSPLVVNGDTLHLEPSATDYGVGLNLNKQLTIIGAGYFLNPANGGNSNLQWGTESSVIGYINCINGSNGSKFIGLQFTYALQFYINSGAANITVEKCLLGGVLFGQSFIFENVSFRKCFFKNMGGALNRLFYTQGSPVLSNLVIENCIIEDIPMDLSIMGSGTNIVRNNVILFNTNQGNISINNTYFANNICNVPDHLIFTGCIVKNNIFSNASQPVPGSFPNQLGVAASAIFTGTGSIDAKYQLKAGSPAIGYGVTISGYTPDCGAFGATDPYKLSGIPAIPTIYSLTMPASISSGTPAINIIFSTRNNN